MEAVQNFHEASLLPGGAETRVGPPPPAKVCKIFKELDLGPDLALDCTKECATPLVEIKGARSWRFFSVGVQGCPTIEGKSGGGKIAPELVAEWPARCNFPFLQTYSGV
jgi:hypothetical protein